MDLYRWCPQTLADTGHRRLPYSLPSQAAEAILSSGKERILITACRPDQSSAYPSAKTS
jgi:hypothetical protein